jgi:hypothetical protein
LTNLNAIAFLKINHRPVDNPARDWLKLNRSGSGLRTHAQAVTFSFPASVDGRAGGALGAGAAPPLAFGSETRWPIALAALAIWRANEESTCGLTFFETSVLYWFTSLLSAASCCALGGAFPVGGGGAEDEMDDVMGFSDRMEFIAGSFTPPDELATEGLRIS